MSAPNFARSKPIQREHLYLEEYIELHYIDYEKYFVVRYSGEMGFNHNNRFVGTYTIIAESYDIEVALDEYLKYVKLSLMFSIAGNDKIVDLLFSGELQ